AATTLETEAYPYAATGHSVCAILDAGRGQFSWATFGPMAEPLHQTTPEAIANTEELMATLPPDTLICGEGLEKFGEDIHASVGKSMRLALPYLPGQRVISLAYMGWQRLQAGQLQDPTTLQPFYLRRPSISQPKRPIVRPTNP
ncbi:MAG: hypothetical protein QGI09_08935, partial [Dehalococcoidia bacterium]|nr:hypothetical protein [Dehalococcoidia bacterium]